MFAGVEKGFFAKHGLKVEVKIFASGVEMINALNGGQVDATVMGSFPLLAGVSKGLPLKLIAHNWGSALSTSQSEVLSVVGLSASGIEEENVNSLDGKRVGLPLGSGAEPYLIGLLRSAGLDRDSVTLIHVAPTNMNTALQNGDVDAVSIWEAHASNALTVVAGTVRVKSGGCEGCYFAGTVLSTESIISERRDDLKALLTAFAESHQWVRNNRAEAADVASRWIPGTKLETLEEALRTLPFDMRITKNTLDGYNQVILPLMLSTDRIEELFDPSTAIDASLIQEVTTEVPQFFDDLDPIPADRAY